MNTFKFGISIAILASALAASAQVTVIPAKGHHATHATRVTQTVNPAVTQALTAVRGNLEAAIGAMKVAQPIYDGHRAKSIEEAHHALVICDHLLDGSKAKNRAVVSEKDHVASKHAHSKYSADQIAASQQQMTLGIQNLSAAGTALQSLGAPTTKKTQELVDDVTKAYNQAQVAFGIHNR